MGVKDFWKHSANFTVSKEVNSVSELKTYLNKFSIDPLILNKTSSGKFILALDVSIWIVENARLAEKFALRQNKEHSKSFEESLPHAPLWLKHILFRMRNLYCFGILILPVFDNDVPYKLKLQNSERTLTYKTFRRKFVLLKQAFDLLGIRYLSGTELIEAEGICGLLNKLDLVHGVITDDSDVFLYGAKIAIRHLRISNSNHNNLPKTGESGVNFNCEIVQVKENVTQSELILFGLLTGTDYSNGISGFGPKSALKLIDDVRSMAGYQNCCLSYIRSNFESEVILSKRLLHLKKKKFLEMDFLKNELPLEDRIINTFMDTKKSEDAIIEQIKTFEATYYVPSVVSFRLFCENEGLFYSTNSTKGACSFSEDLFQKFIFGFLFPFQIRLVKINKHSSFKGALRYSCDLAAMSENFSFQAYTFSEVDMRKYFPEQLDEYMVVSNVRKIIESVPIQDAGLLTPARKTLVQCNQPEALNTLTTIMSSLSIVKPKSNDTCPLQMDLLRQLLGYNNNCLQDMAQPDLMPPSGSIFTVEDDGVDTKNHHERHKRKPKEHIIELITPIKTKQIYPGAPTPIDSSLPCVVNLISP